MFSLQLERLIPGQLNRLEADLSLNQENTTAEVGRTTIWYVRPDGRELNLFARVLDGGQDSHGTAAGIRQVAAALDRDGRAVRHERAVLHSVRQSGQC